MTPKEKAEELISNYRKEILKGKYRISGFVIEELAKQCALIAVDEILEVTISYDDISKDYEFWVEVKQEIEKL